MSGIMMTAMASTPVSAYDESKEKIVAERYALASSTTCDLEISNYCAYLSSKAEGNMSVTKITATQTLEKYIALWIWETVGSASWYNSVNDNILMLNNQKNLYQSGKYRVKTVFTFTSSTGSTETITVYSNEVTI